MRKILFLFFLFFICSLAAEWTIVQTYPIPEGASGLAFDGTYLYCGIYGANGDEVYRIDPSDGSYQLQFTNTNIGDSFGMTYDGNNLWITDHVTSPSVPATAYELDIDTGVIQSQFDLPAHYMSGIAYDNGDFWVNAYYDPDGEVYKVDNTGNILLQFPAPDAQPWDICLENDNLWIADYWGDALYKVDATNGSLLETNPSEGVDPAGIVYDGQYIWYCDNGTGGNDFLYKVDLAGGGAPVIQLGWDEYDFGNTTIGVPATVELPITNTGTADLTIDSMDFTLDDFYTDEMLPFTILPGNTEDITLLFDPANFGNFECMLQISSNDPVTPLEEISLTGYGLTDGPHIVVTPANLNFGDVRTGAVTGRYIEITNQGDEILEITEFDFDIDQFYLDDSIEFPINISSTVTTEIRIWFNPETGDDFSGSCTVHSNDSITPMIDIILEGSGDDTVYDIGDQLWYYSIDTGYDNSPKAIAPISDVTNDMIDDVVVCSEDNFIRCFNGNSSGMADVIWATEITSGNVYSQNGLIITEDIDGDDFKDVVIGTTGADRAIRTLSGKTGALIWTFNSNIYGDGGWVYQVEASYDYNNDDVIDVLAATGNDGLGTGPQRVFCLDGISGDIIWEFYQAGPKFSCIGISDINNDGVPDAIAGGSNASETEGKVWGIDGSDGSQIWEFTTGGSSVWALAELYDFTGDNINDLAAGDFGSNYYGLDSTNGNVEWSGSIGMGLIIRFEGLEDVNGNGHPDIAIARSSQDNAIVIDGQTGDNIWLQPLADQPWVVDKIGDLTGDNVNDIVWGTLFGSNFGYFMDGATGSILSQTSIGSPCDAIAGIPDIASDGSWEMVCGGRDGSLICISGGEAASSSNENSIPPSNAVVELFGNFPNPFNPETAINFNLQDEAEVSIKVFNVKGQLIRTLLNERLSSSYHSVIWNGKDDNDSSVASGVYMYQLKANETVLNRKCILLK